MCVNTAPVAVILLIGKNILVDKDVELGRCGVVERGFGGKGFFFIVLLLRRSEKRSRISMRDCRGCSCLE